MPCFCSEKKYYIGNGLKDGQIILSYHNYVGKGFKDGPMYLSCHILIELLVPLAVGRCLEGWLIRKTYFLITIAFAVCVEGLLIRKPD